MENAVQPDEKIQIDCQQALAAGGQIDAPLKGLTTDGSGSGNGGGDAPCGVILMHQARFGIPDVEIALADAQEMGDILLPDPVAAPEAGSLPAIGYFGDVMTKNKAHGVFHWDRLNPVASLKLRQDGGNAPRQAI